MANGNGVVLKVNRVPFQSKGFASPQAIERTEEDWDFKVRSFGGSNLFRYDDPTDLAQKMDWWLEHPEERERCSASYLGYAKQFDFQTCMDAMEKMMLDTVEKKRHEG